MNRSIIQRKRIIQRRRIANRPLQLGAIEVDQVIVAHVTPSNRFTHLRVESADATDPLNSDLIISLQHRDGDIANIRVVIENEIVTSLPPPEELDELNQAARFEGPPHDRNRYSPQGREPQEPQAQVIVELAARPIPFCHPAVVPEIATSSETDDENNLAIPLPADAFSISSSRSDRTASMRSNQSDVVSILSDNSSVSESRNPTAESSMEIEQPDIAHDAAA